MGTWEAQTTAIDCKPFFFTSSPISNHTASSSYNTRVPYGWRRCRTVAEGQRDSAERLCKRGARLSLVAQVSLGVTQPTPRVAQCLLGATLCYMNLCPLLELAAPGRAAGHARSHTGCATPRHPVARAMQAGRLAGRLQATAHSGLHYRVLTQQSVRLPEPCK